MTPQRHLDRQCWDRLVAVVIEDAIEHLQQIIFDEHGREIRAASVSNEDALRTCLFRYEQGLVELFRFVRISGMAGDGLLWSTFKQQVRRAARESNEEISLRTARNEALYQVERHIEPGEGPTYLRWRDALIVFLQSRAATPLDRPQPSADEEERIAWAVTQLHDIEDHDDFSNLFIAFLRRLQPSTEYDVIASIALQQRLVHEPRFDLVLNLALRWLASCS